MKKLIIILLGVLLLASCLKEEVPFQYTISVHITDDENNPIEKADVTAKLLKTGKLMTLSSKANGYYTFENITEAGIYQVWAHKNNYKDVHNDNVIIDNDKVNSVELELKTE